MKNLILIFAILFGFGVYAQDPIKDKMKETKTKIIKVEENGKIVEKKIKVVTLQEQEVKTKVDSSHYENSDRIDTPVKVTKTVSVDHDNDPFYDSETDMVYYESNDANYTFSRQGTGFIVTQKQDDADIEYGKAWLTTNKGYYLLSTDDYSGLGYFNAKGEFVVEYYDETLGAMVIQTFGQSKL